MTEVHHSKELFLSQSTFCFLKVPRQDLISLLLSFLKKIQSTESSPEHPQRCSVILAFMLSSFCVHLMILQSWNTTAKHQDWLRVWSFSWRGQNMLLPCLCTSFQWDPAWSSEWKPKSPQSQCSNTTTIWRKTSVSGAAQKRLKAPGWNQKGQAQPDPAKGEMDY